MELLPFLCIILVMPHSSQQQFPWIMTKQFIHFDEVRQCSDRGTKDIVWDLKLNRVSRQNLVLQGNIKMKLALDDKVSAIVVVAEKSNGNWIEQAFVFKFVHLCQDLTLAVHSIWTSFWEKAGKHPPILCPIPKGEYVLKNYSTTESIQQVPGLKHGTFKVNVDFLHRNNNRLGCIMFVLHTSTKKQ